MRKLPLKGGPFDGWEVEFDDPMPLRIDLAIPQGSVSVAESRKSGDLLKKVIVHAVYKLFPGSQGERYFRYAR